MLITDLKTDIYTTIFYFSEQSAPSKAEERERGLVCDLLATFLRHYYDSNITMHLFGSSHNGFGFRGSDLDICLVFDNIEDSQVS